MPQPDPAAPAPHPAPPQASPAAVVAVGGDGRVRSWSPAAAALFGRSEAEAVGTAVQDVIPGGDAALALLNDVGNTGEAACWGPVALGDGRWIQLSALTDPSAGGVLLVVGEATARVRAEQRAEALRKAAVELGSSVETARILAVVRSQARTLLGADAVLVDRAGLDETEDAAGALAALSSAVLRRVRDSGQPVALTADEDGAVPLPQGFAAVLVLPLSAPDAEPGAIAFGWQRAVDVDGDLREVAGKLAAPVAVALEHAAQFQALRDAAVRRDRFFSAMSHDLRTPITAIVGYSELLGDGIVGELEEKQQEMVERISQVAGHLAQLVNDILDLAKLDAGRMEFARDEVPLGELVEEAAVTVGPQAHGKRLELRLELDEHRDSRVQVDAGRVRQILVNLLSNAVKFTEHGQVVVCAGMEGDRGWITIRDTGPGLPAGSEEVVFEEFLQLASGNQAKREPGSGLGLAISRRLARAMGGDLTATNGPDGGAIFTLALLAARDEKAGRRPLKHRVHRRFDATRAGRGWHLSSRRHRARRRRRGARFPRSRPVHRCG
ncbi:MAG TPA: PAS domain-containing sensor histidine kinase [Longimicrobiaceae bacterium]|nr:PAS domain-containing sensor histidine kinase [Longimicrobiaceae bacterium]